MPNSISCAHARLDRRASADSMSGHSTSGIAAHGAHPPEPVNGECAKEGDLPSATTSSTSPRRNREVLACTSADPRIERNCGTLKLRICRQLATFACAVRLHDWLRPRQQNNSTVEHPRGSSTPKCSRRLATSRWRGRRVVPMTGTTAMALDPLRRLSLQVRIVGRAARAPARRSWTSRAEDTRARSRPSSHYALENAVTVRWTTTRATLNPENASSTRRENDTLHAGCMPAQRMSLSSSDLFGAWYQDDDVRSQPTGHWCDHATTYVRC